MTPKLLTYYTKLFEFGKLDYITDSTKMYEYFQYFLDYNYTNAEELWDYMLTVSTDQLQSSQAAILLTDHVLALFIAKSDQKAARLITDNATVRNAVFQMSPNAHGWFPLTVAVSLILGAKPKADDILKALSKNTAILGGFETAMRSIVDSAIDELIKKSAGKSKVQMPKKVSALLLEYIAKLKGSDKALLQQRIKEVS